MLQEADTRCNCCVKCCRSRTRFYSCHIACNIARNNCKGGHTVQFNDCAQYCSQCCIRTRKSTQVSDLRSTCVSFDQLATTCVDFGRAPIWTQVDASFLPFGHPAQVDTSWSQVICCYKNVVTNDIREIYGFLRLANPFGHLRKSTPSSDFVDLRRLASPFGQGFRIQNKKLCIIRGACEVRPLYQSHIIRRSQANLDAGHVELNTNCRI